MIDNLTMDARVRFGSIQKITYQNVLDNFRNTKLTWKYLSGEGISIEAVYNKLINEDEQWGSIPIPSIYYYHTIENNGVSVPVIGSYIFDFNGTLFLDNLKHNPKNNKALEYCAKLAKMIKDGKASPQLACSVY